MGWGTDLKEIARRIAMMPKASGLRPRTVIITQGPGEVIVFEQGKYTMFPVKAMTPEEIVSSLSLFQEEACP